MQQNDKNDLIEIGNYPTSFEAQIIVTKLKDQGIIAVIQSASPGIWGSANTPISTGFTVLAPEKHAQRAKEILQEEKIEK